MDEDSTVGSDLVFVRQKWLYHLNKAVVNNIHHVAGHTGAAAVVGDDVAGAADGVAVGTERAHRTLLGCCSRIGSSHKQHYCREHMLAEEDEAEDCTHPPQVVMIHYLLRSGFGMFGKGAVAASAAERYR